MGSFAVALSLGSVAMLPSVAWADEPQAAAQPSHDSPEEIERQAESISRSIMSPFCPGRTVSSCPNAGPWREDIRKWVAEGVDATEIKQRLADRVPEHNLMGVPKNRLGWVLPVGLGVIALGFLIFLMRRLVRPAAPGSTATAEAAVEPVARKGSAAPAGTASRANGEDYDARLNEELDTLEQ